MVSQATIKHLKNPQFLKIIFMIMIKRIWTLNMLKLKSSRHDFDTCVSDVYRGLDLCGSFRTVGNKHKVI